MALRRFKTARPLRVAMRARKPCLRLRLIRLGLYVGCMIGASFAGENYRTEAQRGGRARPVVKTGLAAIGVLTIAVCGLTVAFVATLSPTEGGLVSEHVSWSREFTYPAWESQAIPNETIVFDTHPLSNVLLIVAPELGVGGLAAARVARGGSDGRLAIDTMSNVGLMLTHGREQLLPSARDAMRSLASGNAEAGPEALVSSLLLEAADRGMATAIVSGEQLADPSVDAWLFPSGNRPHSEVFDHDAWLEAVIDTSVDVVIGDLPAVDPHDAVTLESQSRRKGVTVSYGRDVLYAEPAPRMVVITGARGGPTDQLSLLERTRLMINELKRRAATEGRGFFGVVIASSPLEQHRSLSEVLKGLNDLDEATAEAVLFAAESRDTLLVVTGARASRSPDLLSGTGGRATVGDSSAAWMSVAEPVPVFATGPSAEVFSGTFRSDGLYIRLHGALSQAVISRASGP